MEEAVGQTMATAKRVSPGVYTESGQRVSEVGLRVSEACLFVH
jgi:hypothetical protein